MMATFLSRGDDMNKEVQRVVELYFEGLSVKEALETIKPDLKEQVKFKQKLKEIADAFEEKQKAGD